MNQSILRKTTAYAALAAMLFQCGCDVLVDRSRVSAAITHNVVSDATSLWSDMFTYHPTQGPAKPQTRYCYRMSSDIVCYDSVQPGQTAKLYGYQDGDQVSWVQPGGGSLGASGGNPVALRPELANSQDSTWVIENKNTWQRGAVDMAGREGEIRSAPLAAPHK